MDSGYDRWALLDFDCKSALSTDGFMSFDVQKRLSRSNQMLGDSTDSSSRRYGSGWTLVMIVGLCWTLIRNQLRVQMGQSLSMSKQGFQGPTASIDTALDRFL